MLHDKPESLSWGPDAHEAFQHIKEAFSMAPILHHPRSSSPLCIRCRRLDHQHHGRAVSVTWGAFPPPSMRILLSETDPRSKTTALGTAGHQVDPGGVKGAYSPFTVITDHKKLQHLRDAKSLNPCQVRWALFYTFPFYHHLPSRKPLSWLHAPDQPSESEPILPPALNVIPIQWELTKRICDATCTEPALQEGPEGKTYVPSSQRLTLLGSVHKVPCSGHPGSQRPLSLLQRSVLVAQYDRGSHQVLPQLLSLCHVKVPSPSSSWQAGCWFPCLFPKDPCRTSG